MKIYNLLHLFTALFIIILKCLTVLFSITKKTKLNTLYIRMLLKQSIIKYKILLYRLLNKNFLELRKIINKYEKYVFKL